MVSLAAPSIPSPLERLGVPPSRLAATAEGKKGVGWGFGWPAPVAEGTVGTWLAKPFAWGLTSCARQPISKSNAASGGYRAGHKPALEISFYFGTGGGSKSSGKTKFL